LKDNCHKIVPALQVTEGRFVHLVINNQTALFSRIPDFPSSSTLENFLGSTNENPLGCKLCAQPPWDKLQALSS
jgi:hypothetical protein